MTTVHLQNAQETIRNLNADLSTRAGTFNHITTCGTYALINNMISDLSSIKASIKAEEKKITKDITATMVAASGAVDPAGQDLATTNGHSAGSRRATAGNGSGTERHESAGANVNEFPTVLETNSIKYTETAVISILIQAERIIHMLKAGEHGAASLALQGTTTLA